MQRNDAQGTIDSTYSDNTIIDGWMCGGSSGGPWIANFYERPFGSRPLSNQVIGVTSWGATNDAVMGASPFLSSNIFALVGTACKAYPDVCKD
jgi:hypothetical protein